MASDYGSGRARVSDGGVVACVESGSAAQDAGIVAGDSVLAVCGQPVRDILDWQWLTDGLEARLRVRSHSGDEREVTLAREPGSAWGIAFESELFDGVMTCRNDCTFCFIAQLPPGLRDSLYVKDDDFRLSFLSGNFITLTNLSEADADRIVEQHLSPLYVSVHAVSEGVRRLLICRREERALETLDGMLNEGIEAHVQIVLVPGVNDGEELGHTLTWLAEREGILSVGIVPLGYTRYQQGFSASYEDPGAAAKVISQVQPWQFAMRERDGRTWVYLADEFYLNARAPFPTAEWYDDFPQFENGIGMVRSFADDAAVMRVELSAAVQALPDSDSVTLVTSVMAATTIAGALGACEAAGRVRLLVVPNRFFGGNVSVTGLLTGADIADAIAADDAGGVYLVPDVVLNSEGLTLDGLSAEEMVERSGACVRLVSSDAPGLLDGLNEALRALDGIIKE